MPPDTHPIQKALEVVAANPTGGQALTLYALVCTLEFPKAGCLFKLTKLQDLTPEQRTIAYELMDCLAEGQVASDQWAEAKRRMDDLVRGTPAS